MYSKCQNKELHRQISTGTLHGEKYHHLQGGPKNWAPTDLSINRFTRKESTVILQVHQLRATASYIKLVADTCTQIRCVGRRKVCTQ